MSSPSTNPNVPRVRRFTCATAAVNTYGWATDDQTALQELPIPIANTILDIINAPNPTGVGTRAEARQELELWKDSMPTGRYFYSDMLNAASAGRMAVGPINIKPGKISFRYRHLAATSLEAYSFIIKLVR